ncbi:MULTISPECIES: KR domain-containing protein [Micromonospora]|uniref:KR domain-containing protein n=1 Tax=Micromonospora yangpuensis TaxID=683228 RepID=A0A1C6UUB9_9ACTN|nr:KR domain-containing protein [Micromonospora yangpuensis]GGM24356.1 hypothetical protein GCM10012279_48360 [Micromonospora yangpuensis]SCL57566.1 KR domain-containing protein [Micromonospora yangpuensis]
MSVPVPLPPIRPRIRLRALAAVRVPRHPPPRAARWRLVGTRTNPLAERLLTTAYPAAGPTVDLLLLGTAWTSDASAQVRATARARHATLVHTGAGGGSLLRGLTAERPGTSATTIELAGQSPAALRSAAGLLAAPTCGEELTVHQDGSVSTVGWQEFALPSAPTTTLTGREVLVTGGLGGLGVRVALALARIGAHPVLVDVRRPDDAPPDVVRCLDTLRRAQPATRTVHVDLTDPVATTGQLARYRPRAVVHCAGRIAGGTGRELTDPVIDALVAAKVTTLHTALAAIDPTGLRAVLTFGSVTAHGSHPGLAGYALANELLRRETRRLSETHRQARWCTAEWSLWSGAGMARNVVRAAARQLGMVPVPVSTGSATAVRILTALAATDRPPPPQSLVIAGTCPGAEGDWAGRPEGLPGIDAELLAPSGADLDHLMGTVARAAAARDAAPEPGADPAPAATATGPLFVRATVRGDLVECTAVPAAERDAPPQARRRYRIDPSVRTTEEGEH